MDFKIKLRGPIGIWGTGASARLGFSAIETILGRPISFVTSRELFLDARSPFKIDFIPVEELQSVKDSTLIICSESYREIIYEIFKNNLFPIENVYIYGDHETCFYPSKLEQRFVNEADNQVLEESKGIPCVNVSSLSSPIRPLKSLEVPALDKLSVMGTQRHPNNTTIEGIHLFFPYFRADSTERQKEIDSCCIANIRNQSFASVTVICDGEPSDEVKDNLQGCNVIYHSGRLTFQDWFIYARASCIKGLALLCNSDIYFDSSVSSLVELFRFHKKDQPFALISRFDAIDDLAIQHISPHFSQDAWAIRVDDLPREDNIYNFRISLGTKRCDSKFAYVLHEVGYKLLNPCNFVHAIHYHSSAIRSYKNEFNYDNFGCNMYVHPVKSIYSNSWLELAYYQRASYLILRSRIVNWY